MKTKYQILGNLWIKTLAWIVLSLASFSFLINMLGSSISYSYVSRVENDPKGYFGTYEAEKEIMSNVQEFFMTMEGNQFDPKVAKDFFSEKFSNLSMRVLKQGELVVENFPTPQNSLIQGNFYFRKNIDNTGDYDLETVDVGDADYEVQYSLSNPLAVKDQLYKGEKLFSFFISHQNHIRFFLFGGLILAILASSYLIVGAGHRVGKDTITLTLFDRIPLEFAILIVGILFFLLLNLVSYASETRYYFDVGEYYEVIFNHNSLKSYGLLAILMELGGLLLGEGILTIVTRIKAKTIFTNSLLYRTLRFIHQRWLHYQDRISLTWISSILLMVFWALFWWSRHSVFVFLLVLASFIFVLMFVKQSELLSKVMREYAKGNFDYTVSKEGLTPMFSRQLDDLFRVREGVKKNLEDRLKSERLKTELITNVSHDLKTPLTSILNYAQIIKKDQNDEERNEHIDTMIHHANRLKRFTEDILMASKASTGNITVQMNSINCEEILEQAIGEFEDKFKEKNLEIIKTNPNPSLCVRADGDLLWRVIANLFSNQLKYSLENTRIYIDIHEIDNLVFIVMKNVSKEPLNMTENELMERFVQGDSSRQSEGSGLGLSIVESLIHLQHGDFNIDITGDYFQSTIQLEKAD